MKNEEKTECPVGHPYDKKNTRLFRGWRRCRKCQNEWQRAYQRRKRLAEKFDRSFG
jgi:hypothetical protein